MVFFRVFALPHTPHHYRPETLTNLWLDWPAVRSIATAALSTRRGLHEAEADDESVSSLRLYADSLFDAKVWGEATPVYARLCTLRPLDYEYVGCPPLSLCFSLY
jgi:hypothetical protein